MIARRTSLRLEQLQAGDLVFYSYRHENQRVRYLGINHVVMYIGDGKIVEASSPIGAVRVTLLSRKGRPVGASRPSAVR
jgi:cell wall-associated NlpC family hydrolase